MSDLSDIVGPAVDMTEGAAPETLQEAPQGAESAAPERADTQPEASEQAEAPEARARTVPLAALHEERARRKELAAQIEQLRAQQAERDRIIEERLAALMPKPQVPAFEENPAEHLRQKLETVAQTQQATAAQIEAWNRAQQEQAAKAQLAVRVQAAEAEFSRQAPDYLDAIKHLASARVQELMAFGHDEEAARQQSVQELHQHAYWCAANGKDPAAIAYALAKARGYQAKPAAPSAADRFQVQQRGVAASKSLGNGGAQQAKTSVEALLAMSDDEFAEATKGGKWAKLMGA